MTDLEKPAPRRPAKIEKAVDLSKLANTNEAITVRNKMDTITVFVAKVDGNDEVCEFAAHGDGQGGDYMELTSSYLKNPKFRAALQKDILEIVEADNEDVIDAFLAQKDAWNAQRAAKEEADRMVQLQAPRAFSGTQCLAQEGKGQCAEYAISSKTSERPPLCSKHAHLSHQFTPEETGKFTDGKPEVAWSRVILQKGR